MVDLEKRGGGRNLDSSKGGTLCENQKFTVRSTPARWRGDAGCSLLDRESAPDTLVDFHTGGTELPLLAGYAPGTNATHHLAIQKKAKSNLAVAFGRTSSALLDSARRPRPDPEDGSNGSSRTTPTPRQLDP